MPIDAISSASTSQVQRPPNSEYFTPADQKRIVDFATEKFTAQKTQAEADLAAPDAQRVASQTQRLQTERASQVQQQLQSDQFYDSNPQVFQDQTLRAQLRASDHAKFDKAIAGIDQQLATTPTSSAQNAQRSLDQANQILADLKTKGVDAFDIDTASSLRLEAGKAEFTKLRELSNKLYQNPFIPNPSTPRDSFSQGPSLLDQYRKLLGG